MRQRSVEEWLRDKEREAEVITYETLKWAKIAAWMAIVGIVVGIAAIGARSGRQAKSDRVADRAPAVMAAKVVPVTGAMRSGASIILLLGVALIQCYATRTGDGCAPLSVHATMAECRGLAKE